MDTFTSPLERVFALLHRHAVEYVFLGTCSEGMSFLASCIDICYNRTPQNIDRVASALAEAPPKRRGNPPGFPFPLDARQIKKRSRFMVSTAVGSFALRGQVKPIGRYKSLLAHAESYDLAGTPVLVIGRDDRRRVDEHAQRAREEQTRMVLAMRRSRSNRLCQTRGALLNPP